MDLIIPEGWKRELYPFNIKIIHKRDKERVSSVEAFNTLDQPRYNISYLQTYDTYKVEFFGVWNRINLPSNYFSGINSVVDDILTLNT